MRRVIGSAMPFICGYVPSRDIALSFFRSVRRRSNSFLGLTTDDGVLWTRGRACNAAFTKVIGAKARKALPVQPRVSGALSPTSFCARTGDVAKLLEIQIRSGQAGTQRTVASPVRPRIASSIGAAFSASNDSRGLARSQRAIIGPGKYTWPSGCCAAYPVRFSHLGLV